MLNENLMPKNNKININIFGFDMKYWKQNIFIPECLHSLCLSFLKKKYMHFSLFKNHTCLYLINISVSLKLHFTFVT